MNVLFKNIPIGITAYELAEFIELSSNKIQLTDKALHIPVPSIELLEIQDNFTHPIMQFGIVRISPPEIAKEIIKLLDGSVFDQYQMTVREYFIRIPNNDIRNDPQTNTIDDSPAFLNKTDACRRSNDTLLISRQEQDRRTGERRMTERRAEKDDENRNSLNRRDDERRKQKLINSRRI